MTKQARGGAIVLISSTQGLTGRGGDGTAAMDGYCAAKHGVVGLMRTWAHWLAPHKDPGQFGSSNRSRHPDDQQ
jgi:NAD(P)-dependent dehydrogenase (short-subunit alcohol dehydrogenase family)